MERLIPLSRQEHHVYFEGLARENLLDNDAMEMNLYADDFVATPRDDSLRRFMMGIYAFFDSPIGV
jgi:hypothetical protein